MLYIMFGRTACSTESRWWLGQPTKVVSTYLHWPLR